MAIIDELISRLGFELDGKEDLREFKRGMNDAEKGAKGFASSVTQMARNVTLGIGASITAIKGLTAGMFAMANAATGPLDELVKAADRAGVSVEALQELGFAAEQSGASVGEMTSAVEMMSRRLAEAARGQGRAKTALEAYGLSATDAGGNVKSATDFMSELADTFQDLSEAERLDLGQQLGLSRGLITMLAQGNEEIERLRQTARDAGLIFTEEDARNAEAYNDAMNLLMRSVRAMRDRIAIDLLPTLMQMIGGMQEWLSANREVIQQNVGAALERIARHARTLSDNGRAMVESLKGWEPLLLGLARVLFPTAFAIGLLVFAFDDLMTWWSGEGESVMGSFTDWLASFSLISEGMASTIAGIALALGLFAILKPGAFGRFVTILWRLSGAAALMKALGAGAVFTAAGTGLAVIAGVSAGKLFLIAGAVWAIYEAAKALSGVSLGENVREFLKDVAPPEPGAQTNPVTEHSPLARAGMAVGGFLARGPLGGMITGAMGMQSPETFADRFGQYYDNSDKSTNIDMGGVTINTPDANGGRIVDEMFDALQRRGATIAGERPVSP